MTNSIPPTKQNRCAHLVVLILILALELVDGQGRSKSNEAEAKERVGQVARLCGPVVGYQCVPPDQTTVLLWEKPVEGTGVGIAIALADRTKFSPLLEQRALFMNACATGKVEKLNKRYVVRVTEPGQLQVQQSSVSPDFGEGAVSTCAAGVEKPKTVKAVNPPYTPAALSARIQGTVLLEAVILTNGRVGQIRLVQSLDPKHGLDDQAIKALRDWRFVPGSVNGQAVPVVVGVDLSFRLN